MKKKMLTLALVLVSIISFSFAADVPNVNKNVLVSFNKEFVSAKDVKWVNTKNFLKVSFSMNDMILNAYYSSNGELLAVSRFISTDHLPVLLLTNLKSDYAGYWVSDLFEISDDSGTSYYITLENADQKKVLTSSNDRNWTAFKTINKAY